MAIDSVAALIQNLRQSQLLEPGQLNELTPELRRFPDPRSLAQHLLKKNWLTAYQINQLMQGQGANLVLGQYRLLERVGEGGMGQVFKARHQAMGRIVALKVIRKDRLENETAIKRFRREMQVAAKLSHPNVVTAFDADAINGVHFFAMEFVDGSDLSQIVKQKGPLPIAQACEYIRQAALGLQHAHECGLVHRDIKPGNLLLTRTDLIANGPANGKRNSGVGRPIVKVLDLGLARLSTLTDDDSGSSISTDGSVMGTPDYMAPEQAKNASSVDARADIYSLGCTLYFLLSGQVPFPGGSNIEKLINHQMDTPRPIDQLRPDIPPRLKQVIQATMAKRPEERPQTAGDVAALLTPFCEPGSLPVAQLAPVPRTGKRDTASTPHATSSATVPYATMVPAGAKPRRRWLLMGGLALGGVLGSCFIFSVLGLMLAGKSKTTSGTAVALKPPSSQPTGSAPTNFTPTPPAPTGKTVVAQPTAKQTPPQRLPIPSGLVPIEHVIPDDTNIALAFKVKEIMSAPIYRVTETYITRTPVIVDLRDNLTTLGIDLNTDVERVILATAATLNSRDSIWVFQGNFDPRKFRTNVTDLRGSKERRVEGVQRSYHAVNEQDNALYLCLLSANTLVYSTQERFILSALRKASGLLKPDLADKDLARLITNLDSRPSVYVIMGGTLPLSAREEQPQYLGRSLGVNSVSGGLKLASDIQAEFTVDTRDAQAALHIRDKGLGYFVDGLAARPDEMGKLAQLLRTSQPTLGKNNTVHIERIFHPPELVRIFKR